MKAGRLTLKDEDRDEETPEDNIVNTEKQRGNRVEKKITTKLRQRMQN